jgi:hypothetical protein
MEQACAAIYHAQFVQDFNDSSASIVRRWCEKLKVYNFYIPHHNYKVRLLYDSIPASLVGSSSEVFGTTSDRGTP